MAAAGVAAGVPVVAIEHVASTAVPGLPAKPVIDCDIVVAEADVTAASQVLVRRGFRPLGERSSSSSALTSAWKAAAWRQPTGPGSSVA